MFIFEFKCYGKETQYRAIDEAIKTVQFIRNKCLRHWMDNCGVGQKAIYTYSTVLRKEFPFVEKLNSMACQASAERAWSSISRFYDKCRKGLKGKKGYPRFQKDCRSVEYKTSGWRLSDDRKRIDFIDKKGIGSLKLKGTRDLNYFQKDQIKRVRIVRRADSYYVQFCIQQDARILVQKELEPTKRCVGIDVGLKVFYANSDGETVEIPRHYRKAEKRLNRLNRRKSRKFRKGAECTAACNPDLKSGLVGGQPQSNNYRKARNRYARKHLRVSRQRRGFVEREALRVIRSNDLVAYEDLNVKGLVKNRHLAKSISDAAWSMFRHWLEYFGWKYGKITIAVPPHNTSQNCSNCGKKVPKSLSTRTHVCGHCGYTEDRDINASINILKLAIRTAGHAGTAVFETGNAWGEGTAIPVGVELASQVQTCRDKFSR